MQVHLTSFDIEVLRQQAVESLDLDDGGESFVEEVLTRMSDEDLEIIEDSGDEEPEDFFRRVFEAWHDEEGDIVETLGSLLEEIDVELDYGEVEEEAIEESEGWSDVESLDAEDEEKEFEGF